MDLSHSTDDSGSALYVSFDTWTGRRKIASLGTNSGAEKLPFQNWHHFKEAFAPELVARAVQECDRKVENCIDPFGGSGTTALTCQFLGVQPTTIEVNPYLADLIEAKLHKYDADDLALDLTRIVRIAADREGDTTRFSSAPASFIEAEGLSRWVFNKAVAKRLARYLEAIDQLSRPSHKRLFKVLLGGMLVGVSNVVINGKGRRYRQNWKNRKVSASSVDELFITRAQNAISEIHTYRHRRRSEYELFRGDSLKQIERASAADIAIFSPPYPNSFDYTDVYNIELWMLGYLGDKATNRSLRQSTLCSHVQIKRDFCPAPRTSDELNRSLENLEKFKSRLWSPWIPQMIGGYFSDMQRVLQSMHSKLNCSGEIWAVVGDSLYAGIKIPVATILAEMAPSLGYRTIKVEPFRSMRASAQQGGRHQLDETLIVLRKEAGKGQMGD